MLVRITATAREQYPREQYLGTIRRYLTDTPHRPARPQAARRLIDSYEQAVAVIGRGPNIAFDHPRPYPALRSYGHRWIKIHRYWFGFLPGPDPIITNILDEVADIPRRVSADRYPIDAA